MVGAGVDRTDEVDHMDAADLVDAQRSPGTPRAWFGLVAAGALVLIVAAMVWWSVRSNGQFSYPLDDPYIHLRLGQNLWSGGVLGVNPGEFASAASSMLWPAVIAPLTGLFDTAVGIPLVLATLAAAVTLALIDPWARCRGVRPGLRITLLVGMVIVVPLALMSLTGMEHTLQIGLTVLLASLCVDATLGESVDGRHIAAIGGTTFVLALTRPEAVFVVAVLGLLLLLRRRVAAAVALGAGLLVPFLGIAVLNVGQGWPAVPASITAKSIATHQGIARYLPNPEYILSVLRRPRLVAVVGIVVVLLWLGRRIGDRLDIRARRWGWCALGITALHVCYAQTGWLYRYEAYLVALCLCASALLAESLLRNSDALGLSSGLRRATVAVVGLLMFVALADGARVTRIGLVGMREIHDQQVQMAAFAAANCPGCRVALNDIGVVSLYGDNEVTDTWGLANRAVIESKLRGDYDAEALERIAREDGATWAMVYAYEGGIPGVPKSWIKIGDWKYDSKVVVGGSDVAFFAIDPADAERLKESFEAWPAPPHARSVPAS